MEFEAMVRRNAFDVIYEPDRKRVLEAAKTALISGEVLDVSYRMYRKDGNLILDSFKWPAHGAFGGEDEILCRVYRNVC